MDGWHTMNWADSDTIIYIHFLIIYIASRMCMMIVEDREHQSKYACGCVNGSSNKEIAAA